jgi:cellulose 1,4-beta-cellobiosidase
MTKHLLAFVSVLILTLGTLAGLTLTHGTAFAAAGDCTLSGSNVQSTNNPAYKIQANEFDSGAPLTINDTGCNQNFAIQTSGIDQGGGGEPGAYPSLFYGCHWGDCSTGTGLPLAVTSVENPGTVTTTDNTSYGAGGKTDNSYDIWFNPNKTTDNNSSGLEMMIWLDSSGGPSPAGSEVAENVNIGGNLYNVWDNSGTVSFRFATTTDSVTNLDLAPFTSYAVQQGYMPSTDYLIDVEAGFELWSNGAGDAVNNFAVNVNNGGSQDTVPNVVGRTDLSTADGIISSAGLTPANTGASGYGNHGTVTAESPAAGTQVSPGSTVTITYTLSSGYVAVPNEIGRTDLSYADSLISAAGLTPANTGDSGVGNHGHVSAQSPPPGQPVATGSTDTLTYTVP